MENDYEFKKIVTIICLVLALGMTGCAKTNEKASSNKNENDTLVLAVASNPLYSDDRATMTIQQPLYAPLYWTDDNSPALAEDIQQSDDGLVYTVDLKDNLKWHDGEPITAEDIAFTIDSALDDKNQSPIKDMFLVNGKSVETKVINNKKMEIILPEVISSFDENLKDLRPIPKHIFEKSTNIQTSKEANEPIGSGPYKFVEFKPDGEYVLEAFDYYYYGKPQIQNVIYRVIKDNNVAVNSLKTGEIDGLAVDVTDYDYLEKDEKLNSNIYDENMLTYLVFNQNQDALKSVDLRKEISYALNRKELIELMYGSNKFADEGTSFLTPNTKYHTDQLETYHQDMEKAKELVDKSGVDKNQEFVFLYNSGNKNDEAVALYVQQQLKDIGLENVKLDGMDRNAMLDIILDHDSKDFSFIINGYIWGNDPDGYSPSFLSDGMYNYANYKDSNFDSLWNEGRIEKDENKREKIYRDIQQKIANEALIYPISYKKSLFETNDRVKGIEEAKLVPITNFRDLSKLSIKE